VLSSTGRPGSHALGPPLETSGHAIETLKKGKR
jgi:hypothetical protein